MKFFDPKEEVLDIQLTPYGKFLYSKGLFDPKSYSFSDSEVLYNPACAGFEESQNSASFRITEETPYGKITSRNSQAEAGMADIGFSELKNKQSVLQDSINAKLNSLGSMTVGNQIGPKIKLFVLEGELSSSSPFYSSPDSAGLS